MPSIEYNDGGEIKTLFSLPESGFAGQSVLAFALPKSGSVLLNGILRMLSQHVGITFVPIMEHFFKLGLAGQNIPASTSKIFLENGYCFGGFRYLPKFEIPLIGKSKTILLVRDPRDMLVSHYYSMRESHVEPGNTLKSSSIDMSLRKKAQSLDIDAYVLEQVNFYKERMRAYIDVLLSTKNLRIFKYEDMIYNKVDFVREICDHYDWSVDEQHIVAIAKQWDVFPEEEEPSKHVRQVHPGNFEKKLKPETIGNLNTQLCDEMHAFGYHS